MAYSKKKNSKVSLQGRKRKAGKKRNMGEFHLDWEEVAFMKLRRSIQPHTEQY